jgi:hypothetical protein
LVFAYLSSLVFVFYFPLSALGSLFFFFFLLLFASILLSSSTSVVFSSSFSFPFHFLIPPFLFLSRLFLSPLFFQFHTESLATFPRLRFVIKMGAPVYADLNKPVKNVLGTGFGAASHSAEIKTPNQSAFLTAKLDKPHGAAAPKATFTLEKLHAKSGAVISASVATDNAVKLGAKKPELLPGLLYGVEVTTTLGKADAEKVTSTLEYVKRDLGLSAVADIVCARGSAVGTTSFLLGRGALTLGTEAQLDVKAAALTRYDAGLAYDLPNTQLVAQLKNSANQVSLGAVQTVNKDVAVALEAVYGLKAGDVSATAGVQVDVDRATTVRAKVAHGVSTVAHVGVVRKVAPGVKATLGAEVNVKNVGDYRFGAAFVFDDRI